MASPVIRRVAYLKLGFCFNVRMHPKLTQLNLSRRTIVALAVFAVLPVLVYLSDPYPTRSLNLAVGQKGTSYEVLGKNIQTYFQRYGLEVNLVETTGMQEGVVKLDDDQSVINAAFMTAGQPAPVAWSGLVSLGSVQYSPLWMIYRGATPQDFRDFIHRKIAIGADGTNTQALFRALAGAYGFQLADQSNLLRVKHAEAVTLFNAGLIDAIFIVDGIDSDNIRNLLQNPDNQIYSFQRTDALTWQYPYLSKLIIPKGALDLKITRPNKDTDLLATSTTLLVEENTHPYIQWLLLKAIRDIHNEGDHHFSPENFFPARLDSNVALSEIADRYYDSGFPELVKYMPFWLAVYLDRFWVVLLSFLAIVLPVRELWAIVSDLRRK